MLMMPEDNHRKNNEDNDQKNNEEIPESNVTSNWTIHVSDSEIKTIMIDNISMAVKEEDIKEFFSFSGDIRYVEMQRESETTQFAYVTFKEPQGVDTAVLLSGATIADRCVTIKPVDDYRLPPEAQLPPTPEKQSIVSGENIKKAEDVVSSMIAKGFVLGKDAVNRARELDQRHQWTSNASATVASIDQKMGLSEKLIVGTAVVNDKVKEMDERYQVSEKTKSAIALAEQTASNVGSTILTNRYVSAGASWVSSAISAVTRTAEDVGNLTKEKVEKAKEDKKQEAGVIVRDNTMEGTGKAAPAHIDDYLEAGGAPAGPTDSPDKKLAVI